MATDTRFRLVRCPHCAEFTQIRRDVKLDDTQCPSCGSYFDNADLLGPIAPTRSEHAEGREFPVKLVAIAVVVASMFCGGTFILGHRQGRSDDTRQLNEAQAEATASREMANQYSKERDQIASQRDALSKDIDQLRKTLLAAQESVISTGSALSAEKATASAKASELTEVGARIKGKDLEIEQLKSEVLFTKQLLDSTRAKLKAQERVEDVVALARAKASETAFVRINEYRITAPTSSDRLNIHSAFLILVRINDKHNKDQDIDLPKITEFATPSVMRECVALVRIGGDALMENGKHTLGESWARALTPKK